MEDSPNLPNFPPLNFPTILYRLSHIIHYNEPHDDVVIIQHEERNQLHTNNTACSSVGMPVNCFVPQLKIANCITIEYGYDALHHNHV